MTNGDAGSVAYVAYAASVGGLSTRGNRIGDTIDNWFHHYEDTKPGQAIGALSYTIPIE